jgi:uncharacterized protein YgiM (DUF1202 family)
VQPATAHRLFDRLTLGLVIILVTVPLTMLELAHPSLQTMQTDVRTIAARLSYATTPTPAPKVATKPTTQAAVKPTTPAPVISTATTNSYVHLRATESVSSPILTNLNAGTVVQLRDDANATWQGVTYQGQNGYIYRAYLQYKPATATP